MAEKVALSCLNCDYCAIITVPDIGVQHLIQELKDTHPCGKMKMIQSSWVNDAGELGHVGDYQG